MHQVNINNIANLHNDWLRGLEFYEQDLSILQERLEEIAKGNTGREVLEKIEYFQDELIIHRNAIDELKHLINANLKAMEIELLKTGVFVDEFVAAQHRDLNEQYLTEEKLVNELRHEFYRFAAKWM